MYKGNKSQPLENTSIETMDLASKQHGTAAKCKEKQTMMWFAMSSRLLPVPLMGRVIGLDIARPVSKLKSPKFLK